MNNIEVILKYLENSETVGVEEIILKGFDVRVLNDYIRTQKEKIRQFKELVIYLDKDLTNVTKELEELKL